MQPPAAPARFGRGLPAASVEHALDGLPQIDLTGMYGHTVRLFDDIDDSRFKDWAVAIGMRWEFFDGGRRRLETLPFWNINSSS